MEKYKPIIKAINHSIRGFSVLLNQELGIPIFNKQRLSNNEYCWDLTKKSWDEVIFPSDESKGVYIILGTSSVENKIGAYIGKASYKSRIGNRLYSHLSYGKRKEKYYPLYDKDGKKFYMELVMTIPLEKQLVWFPAALEEYLIHKLQKKNVHLLNAVGHKPKAREDK